MKIAYVIDDALDRPDGVQEYVRIIGKAMADRGHEVHALCSGDAGQCPPGFSKVVSLTGNVAVSFNGNHLRSPRPARRSTIRELMAAERYDVIHVQSPHSPFFAARVVRESRRVLGKHVRIVGSFIILPDGAVSSLGIRLLGLALRPNLRLFDAFAGVSGPAAAFAAKAYGLSTIELPIPIDVGSIATQAAATPWTAPSGGKVVIAFLGRLVERKGVRELIEAVAAMPTAVREKVTVRIGGKGPLMGELTELVSARGLGSVVSFEGFIGDEEKPGFLAAADVAVFPALGGESFGIVLTEAMAAGAGAVLGGDNPGYSWTLGDRDAVVDAKDTEAFALRLAELVTDKDARQRLFARQQSRVRQLDIAPVALATEAFYSQSE